jgi:hypothetical protein
MHDPSETAGLLSDVDQGVANALMEAFADKAHALQADMGAVMWAISMMKAAVVARASSEDEATWVSATCSTWRSRRRWHIWRWAVDADSPVINRRKHPLDRAVEFKQWGWDLDELIREARAAGWVVSRRVVRGWVRAGMLPPPGRRTDRG